MSSIFKRLIASFLALILFVGAAPLARAASPAVPAPPAPPAAAMSEDGEADDSQNPAPTPPRLSYINGEVSFWRPGGEDWAPAQVNTPLAPGDQLYTGNRGNLEVQIDSRSFVRAWGDSQLGIENHEPDFLQIKVAAGHVTLDLRVLDSGRTVELDTPAAAFTIERPGYYRVDVTPDRTSFVTRRGGTASMTPAGGQAVSIAASEQVVLTGAGTAAVQTFVAPEQDVWDRWNYARTEALVDTVSARYVPQTVSGVDDLDQHGFGAHVILAASRAFAGNVSDLVGAILVGETRSEFLQTDFAGFVGQNGGLGHDAVEPQLEAPLPNPPRQRGQHPRPGRKIGGTPCDQPIDQHVIVMRQVDDVVKAARETGPPALQRHARRRRRLAHIRRGRCRRQRAASRVIPAPGRNARCFRRIAAQARAPANRH